MSVASIDEIVAKMKQSPKGVRFSDLSRVSLLRQATISWYQPPGVPHPWPGDPRVNIQNAKGKAKPYQVRQVLWAIERIEKEDGKGS